MFKKDFILQRICIYAGEKINPNADGQVKEVLQSKFNISLPQRRSMTDALKEVAKDHEIISLIIRYRAMC